MFEKDIERSIKGVIKVGQKDSDNIHQELDEYVVTRELRHHMAKFYDNYQKGINGYTDKMGVWISGFFGSGKSHFLKILSYLLENKTIDGRKPIEYFDGKLEDSMLFGNMKNIGETNTEAILFNIDSKSAVDGKSKEDAILKVFLKVFNEHRGFYGDVPGVAEMEKHLANEGRFDMFKSEFKQLSGYEWEKRRRTFYFDKDYVVGALTKSNGMTAESARDWFDNGVNNYKISIESFAKDVKEYIDSKGRDFHLVFLVDEIGQYIGDDSKLMLNLQTLAEDLGTYCQGKAWIMVTSQESIDEISKNIKGNDFSKIQGRFDTRLSLSSISVDEVIKKRILGKKDYVDQKLRQVYHENSAMLKNIISFKEATTDLRSYEDDVEYAEVYPFVPYQFKLLQNVFEQVRRHGSSGKNLSEGERSMLSAFKESALRYKDDEEGALVPFYAFYETIKEFLNPSISRVIDGAYLNPALKDNPFNMEVLKVLFMIKYIKELPANIENLATLMITNINEDKLALKENIVAAVNLLTRETLIQKNGDQYIFLTDDEQDINREIKQISIDPDQTKKELRNYMFQHFYDDKKYRYSKQYIFDFNKIMDEKNHGSQTAKIGINVLSPLSDNYDKSDSHLRMMSASTGELVVKLGGSHSYIEEMEEAIKISEYYKRTNVSLLPENIQNIINSKKAEERVRINRAKNGLEDALKNATFYINGEPVDMRGSSVRERINNALKLLVESVYTKLSYIKDFMNRPEDLLHVLTENEQLSVDQSYADNNSLALKEIQEYIDLQSSVNKQIRVKLLHDRYADKPYGWNILDVSALIAMLMKDQRIMLRLNGENLDTKNSEIINALTKSSEVDKVIVTKRVIVDPKLLRTAKNICKELWNKTDIADDEDGLIRDIKTLIDQQKREINGYKSKYEDKKYPGKALLNKGLEYFSEFDHVTDNLTIFTKLKDMEEDLLNWEEDVQYVKSFFENQKTIYDNGLGVASLYEENADYLTDEGIKKASERLLGILKDPMPYGKIKNIPEYVNTIDTGLKEIIDKEKSEAKKQIKEDIEYLEMLGKQEGVKEETRNYIQNSYIKLGESVDALVDIMKIQGAKSRSQSFKVKYIKAIEDDIKEVEKANEKAGISVKPPVKKVKQVKQIKIKNLLHMKKFTTENDVEIFIRELEKKLKQEIRENKDVELID